MFIDYFLNEKGLVLSNQAYPKFNNVLIVAENPKHRWNLKEQDLSEPTKFDDFTVNDLKVFEKELNCVKIFKINNIITENNIVKSFEVEKC